MKRRLLLIAAVLASLFGASSGALAQSACPYIAYGAVLTAAQWNACFSAKQDALNYVPVNKAGDVMLGKLTMFTSSPTGAGINLPQGSAPTNPNNGDLWTTLSGIFVRINGFTIGPLAGANSTTFTATAPIAVTFPSGIVTYALNKDANFSTVGGNLALASGGIAYPSTVTGGAQGAGTINASGLFINGVAVASSATAITALTGDVTATGPGSVAATIAANAVTYAKFQQVAASSLVGNATGSLANTTGITLGATLAFSGSALQTAALSGDLTTPANSFVTTLATVNSNVGTFGSATQSVQFTVNGKGLITAAANVTVTPAVGSITGLGTGVATALGVNVGSAGAFVTFNGAGGTPSSMVGTNITGTAAGLTAGNVTTNANLTGPVTSVGNVTSVANAAITNTMLATMATNTVKGNATSGSASPTDLAVGSCSTPASALIWTTNTGFGCNTSITANAVPAANLTGTTLAAGVTGSSLTSVGALGAGSATTGFTIAGASVTWSSQIAGANVAVVANASGSPSATFGVMKADGTTIQCTSGTCSAVGGVATSVTVGTTTVNSASGSNQVLTTGTVVGSTGTLANVATTALTFGTGTLNLSGNLATTGAFNTTFAQAATTTVTLPGSSAKMASLDLTDQAVIGGGTITPFAIGTVTSGTTTIDCGKMAGQTMTNGGASTIAAPSNDGFCAIRIVNNGSAGAITFSGFTVNSSYTGAALDTVNAHAFIVSITRLGGSSVYSILPQQ